LLTDPRGVPIHPICPLDPSRGAAVKATDADYDAISLLSNKKGASLLMAMGGGSSDDKGRLVFQPSRGKVLLPDLQVGSLRVCV
jgi:hypothetical protein